MSTTTLPAPATMEYPDWMPRLVPVPLRIYGYMQDLPDLKHLRFAFQCLALVKEGLGDYVPHGRLTHRETVQAMACALIRRGIVLYPLPEWCEISPDVSPARPQAPAQSE